MFNCSNCGLFVAQNEIRCLQVFLVGALLKLSLGPSRLHCECQRPLSIFYVLRSPLATTFWLGHDVYQ